MKLREPFRISSRLLPSLQVAGATISLAKDGQQTSGKPRYRWFIDLPDGTEHTAADMHGWGSTQEMFASLLSSLTACAESVRYGAHTGHPGENADLFPPAVAEWAADNSDALDMLSLDVSQERGAASLIEE